MSAAPKAALLIYPMFCHWEIALTLATLNRYEKPVDIIAKDKNPVRCEEGLLIVPDLSLADFVMDEYDCLLLSGIGGHPDAVLYDDAYQTFLRPFADRDDILVAAISLAPALLGRAGLLRNKKFCVGMYEEDREELSFFEYEHQQRAPIVADGNRITAMGAAFREFALETAKWLGFDCKEDLWQGVRYPIRAEDYIFRLTDA